MNVAVTKTIHSIPRWVWLGVAILVLMLFCAGIRAFDRGPLYCDNCGLGVPDIDKNTEDFLVSNLVPIDGYVPLWMYLTNTTYIICNKTHCATYRQTFDGGYLTDGKVERDQPSGGSHGTGSGDGNGNSNDNRPPAGGGWTGGGSGGGSGTVTVGPPSPNKPGVPNQDN